MNLLTIFFFISLIFYEVAAIEDIFSKVLPNSICIGLPTPINKIENIVIDAQTNLNKKSSEIKSLQVQNEKFSFINALQFPGLILDADEQKYVSSALDDKMFNFEKSTFEAINNVLFAAASESKIKGVAIPNDWLFNLKKICLMFKLNDQQMQVIKSKIQEKFRIFITSKKLYDSWLEKRGKK